MEKIKLSLEDKALLVKDLCARLPYAVTVEHTSGFRGTLHDIVIHHTYNEDDTVKDYLCYTNFFGEQDYVYIEYFKPYLFPLSSMTEEQYKEMLSLNTIITKNGVKGTAEGFEYLYKNHFDIKGLIGKGLALDATDKNIY